MTRVLDFSMPVRVISETNAREHWAKKHTRKKEQKDALFTAWLAAINRAEAWPVKLPCVVRLTRVGPKRLDDDNLSESFKAIRDAIAWAIDVDDGDDRIKFEYAQEATGKRVYAVKVEVYSHDAD